MTSYRPLVLFVLGHGLLWAVVLITLAIIT